MLQVPVLEENADEDEADSEYGSECGVNIDNDDNDDEDGGGDTTPVVSFTKLNTCSLMGN